MDQKRIQRAIEELKRVGTYNAHHILFYIGIFRGDREITEYALKRGVNMYEGMSTMVAMALRDLGFEMPKELP
tara:strand:+ start:879 stop:1097 length:219 start_codon:yes stop_codon:yes gene_type:complete